MNDKTRLSKFVVSSNVASKKGAALKVVSFKLTQAGERVLTTTSESISRATTTATEPAAQRKAHSAA